MRMSSWLAGGLLLGLLGICGFLQASSARALADVAGGDGGAWRKPYQGQDATGPQVIGFWSFDPAAPEQDASGQGHALKLRGEVSGFIADDRFGGALEVRQVVGDKANGAQAANKPALTPPGAFSGEMWIRPSAAFADAPASFLLDKKYYNYVSDRAEANHDYLLLLRGAKGQWQRRMEVHLGFGSDSAIFASPVVQIAQGQWQHVAFTYDGQGTVTFFLDGRRVGEQTHQGRAAISAGPHALTIGDRVGSTFQPFAGAIAQVRLSHGVVPFATGAVTATAAPRSRLAFSRMEKGAAIALAFTNDTGRILEDASLVVSHPSLGSVTLPAGRLLHGQSVTLNYPVETQAKAGRYELTLQPMEGGNHFGPSTTLTIDVANRITPGRMPVVMWGYGHIDKLMEGGFTHQFFYPGESRLVWEAGKPVDMQTEEQIAKNLATLDKMLAHQMQAVPYLSTPHQLYRLLESKQYADQAGQFMGLDREGKPYARSLDANIPRIQQLFHDAGAATAKTFGHHPALNGVLIHSEVRDHTEISWRPENQEAYRKATGQAFPPAVQAARGTHHRTLADFPVDRVVPDDHPLLTFYRWFWKDGDGWNPGHSQAHRGIKSTGREDVWTFFDPAVRVPSLYGSGGEVDVLSQWTYTYPDPLKIVFATDEMFTMAKGRPGQEVMTMTQVIWYRSQTAPIANPKSNAASTVKLAAWETAEATAKAQYISIAPDIARQSTWLMLTQPVRGIMYHGMQSLAPPTWHDSKPGAYVYTNDQAHVALADTLNNVVAPLGPTLLQVPQRKKDIAFLESFTSQMLAGRGAYGWAQGWQADAYLALLWAQLDPQVIYEQTLLEEGLDGYKVLVLTDCDVLPRSVALAIQRWQERGGIIIGDERLTPAIQPDILIASYNRVRKGDQDKAALQKLAAQIRRELDGHYKRLVDSSTPDLIVRARQWGDALYIFAINDKRTFGDYVGQHGMVMEKGLPLSGEVKLARTGAVYDVLASRQVAVSALGNASQWPVELAAGDGKLFLVTPKPIAKVTLAGPTQGRAGQALTLRVRVVDAAGQPVAAVLPVRVDIVDAQGDLAEFSGHHAAVGGELTITLDLPSNAPAGTWNVRVRDLASGQVAQQLLEVTR